MVNQEQHRFRSSRRVIIVLILSLGLLSALGAGFLLLRQQSAQPFHHVKPALNTGASILYLGSSSFDDDPTQMTMLHTSDGSILWQYSLPGTLSAGEFGDINQALQANQGLQIVNGVIYFVVDPMRLGNPNRMQKLMALRASDGKLLWQRQIQGDYVEMLGVSDGVVCISATRLHSPTPSSWMLYGYSTESGSLVWQHQLGDVGSTVSPIVPFLLLDGILYGSSAIRNPSTHQIATTFAALQASTGRTLWQYAQTSPPGQIFYLLGPMIGDNGVVVFSSASGVYPTVSAVSLIGIRESDGTVLWRGQLPSAVSNLPYGGANASGIIESNGLLYFVDTPAGTVGLQLNALQMQDGKIVWQQPITSEKSWLWYMTVANGNVYVVHALSFQGVHPTYKGLSIEAFTTDSGARRWSDQPTQEVYTEIHSASSHAALLSAGSTVSGVRVSDGSVLWQKTLASILTVANDIGIFFSAPPIGSDTGSGSLCGLQPDTGATLWCKQFSIGLAAIVLGP